MCRQRIQNLIEEGIIGEDSAAVVERVIDMMAADYPGIPAGPADLFLSHLAMALDRIKKGEILAPLDVESLEELSGHPRYQNALLLRSRILSLCPVTFPESERQFLTIHICNMLTQKEVPHDH